MFGPIIGVLFDGFAYGMLLFLLSVGLSVTLGMMNFVNLAHCAFAMLGGYVTVTLANTFGWPFLATLPMAFIAAALVSVVLERTLYRRLYRASDLDQVLLTIGLAFMSIATCGLYLRHHPAAVADARLPARLGRLFRHQFRGLSPVPGRGRARGHAGARADARIHPLRPAGARRGRQPAHGARPRHQCRRHLRACLRARLRACRSRRRARDRDRRSRSVLRADLSRLCADRGVGRRAGLDLGLFRRRRSDRRQRHRRQVLRAAVSAPS